MLLGNLDSVFETNHMHPAYARVADESVNVGHSDHFEMRRDLSVCMTPLSVQTIRRRRLGSGYKDDCSMRTRCSKRVRALAGAFNHPCDHSPEMRLKGTTQRGGAHSVGTMGGEPVGSASNRNQYEACRSHDRQATTCAITMRILPRTARIADR